MKLAIEKFEAAGAMDGAKLLEHARGAGGGVFAIRLNQREKAEELVDRVLKVEGLEVDQRVWGLCKKIELAIARRRGVGGGAVEAGGSGGGGGVEGYSGAGSIGAGAVVDRAERSMRAW